jgi:lipid-A-disaccharide synthase
MIVMYNASRWFYQLVGRWLITTPYLSIPNLLAGRQIVPEFMPYYRSVDPIVETARQWLASPEKLASIRRELLDATAPIAVAGAAGRTTQMLTELIDRRRSQRGD